MNGNPPIGAGALQAFVRQGFKELAQVIPATPESVRVVEEPGSIGNPTPQIVTAQMKPKDPELMTKQAEIEMDM